jgi:hypothetical protein
MPWEKKPHNRLRRFARHNRELIFVGCIAVFILAAIFFLFYFMSSGRFLKPGGGD